MHSERRHSRTAPSRRVPKLRGKFILFFPRCCCCRWSWRSLCPPRHPVGPLCMAALNHRVRKALASPGQPRPPRRSQYRSIRAAKRLTRGLTGGLTWSRPWHDLNRGRRRRKGGGARGALGRYRAADPGRVPLAAGQDGGRPRGPRLCLLPGPPSQLPWRGLRPPACTRPPTTAEGKAHVSGTSAVAASRLVWRASDSDFRPRAS